MIACLVEGSLVTLSCCTLDIDLSSLRLSRIMRSSVAVGILLSLGGGGASCHPLQIYLLCVVTSLCVWWGGTILLFEGEYDFWTLSSVSKSLDSDCEIIPSWTPECHRIICILKNESTILVDDSA